MIEESEVTVTDCEQIRSEYSHNEGLEALSAKANLELPVIRYHLYGDCDHTTDVDPVKPPVEHRVSLAECNQYRRRVQGGESPQDISDEIDTRWRTLVRHLAGECDHDCEVEPLELVDLYKHTEVPTETCEEFRRLYHEEGLDVLTIAGESEFTYQTVLRHANGRCSHETDVEPKPVLKRGENIDRETCKQLRERWRSDTGLTFDDLGDEFGCNGETAERHVKFKCPHPHVETLVEEMAEFDDLLSDDDEPVGFDRGTILEEATEDALDIEEAGVDVVEPGHSRTTTTRIVRNSEPATDLKEAYEFRCQVCGQVRHRDGGNLYAESHHLRPLSPPHDGPDVPENVLILCPNHHADFDYGVIAVDPETLEIHHSYDESVDGEPLTVIESHSIEKSHLEYHFDEISEIGE
ncbi:HNH endonuclease [Natrialbaceae archaeon A-CW2]|uniref:HNH endonuclease n=1 Tax=Natronosalvus amylolyticus TaxID=2961994 RepID=UPI0020C9FC95|nr:HNH endonuclease [Natronosalvus amylolyticus]